MRVRVKCKFNITITTNSLNLKIIPDESQYRHDLILELHRKGYTDTEISQYLNENNILTPKGKLYYLNLVWVTRRKLRLREVRNNSSTNELSRLIFY